MLKRIVFWVPGKEAAVYFFVELTRAAFVWTRGAARGANSQIRAEQSASVDRDSSLTNSSAARETCILNTKSTQHHCTHIRERAKIYPGSLKKMRNISLPL